MTVAAVVAAAAAASVVVAEVSIAASAVFAVHYC